MRSTINTFKTINTLEGVSFLLLLFIAMPAKHLFGMPMAVTVAGWTHGLLFIAYIMAAYRLAEELNWSDRDTLRVVIAGMLPFAFLYVNRKVKAAVSV